MSNELKRAGAVPAIQKTSKPVQKKPVPSGSTNTTSETSESPRGCGFHIQKPNDSTLDKLALRKITSGPGSGSYEIIDPEASVFSIEKPADDEPVSKIQIEPERRYGTC